MLKPSVGLMVSMDSPLNFFKIVVLPALSRPLQERKHRIWQLRIGQDCPKTDKPRGMVTCFSQNQKANFLLLLFELLEDRQKPHGWRECPGNRRRQELPCPRMVARPHTYCHQPQIDNAGWCEASAKTRVSRPEDVLQRRNLAQPALLSSRWRLFPTFNPLNRAAVSSGRMETTPSPNMPR